MLSHAPGNMEERCSGAQVLHARVRGDGVDDGAALSRVHAAHAVERVLLRAQLPALEMLLRNLAEGLSKQGEAVEGGGALENGAQLRCLLPKLLVDLVQRLNVIGGEGDWDGHEVGAASLVQGFHRVLRARAKPRQRSHLGLPTKDVAVGDVHLLQQLSDAAHRCPDLLRVRVSCVDTAHGQGVCREEKDDFMPYAFIELFQPLDDPVRKGIDESWMGVPSIDE
mmetsp:Transcript_27156/g.55344  ORF Transcript_27156/g.55344 Transcript_27156/m.55344 type:complete len:224 (-) Transcript_27156:599-1270(-)